ncbi:hypothetical protein LptCag_1061 [Leptospirillum ferriphilum]|uniref:Uncharacterized protein n=1 Tax=Leptospirillum ferriphilum TaxID=178606 RepID=A0A094W9S9_9BACT|nr:hypothetical protein LptCag_1061 [Leptospirillum ferriphilum]
MDLLFRMCVRTRTTKSSGSIGQTGKKRENPDHTRAGYRIMPIRSPGENSGVSVFFSSCASGHFQSR